MINIIAAFLAFVIIIETVIGMIYGLFVCLEEDAYKFIFKPYIKLYKNLDKEVNKVGTLLGVAIIFLLTLQFFFTNLVIIFIYYLITFICQLIIKSWKMIFRKRGNYDN